MTKTDTRSSKRKSLAADTIEGRFFADLARLTPTSDAIKGVEFRLGRDSDDYPAVWVTILTNADDNPSTEKMAELNRVGETLRAAVLNSDIDRWPYVEIMPV
jgi:hypothetical protein